MIDLKPILTAVRQAADLTRQVQRAHFTKSVKDHKEPVTIADYGAQALICRMIAREFPADAVLAEERGAQFSEVVSDAAREEVVGLVSAVLGEPVSEADLLRWLDHGRDRDAERTWVIDPVDGTKGFIAMRRYSIAVAALEGGLPIAGVVGSPGYPTPAGEGLLFYAQRAAAYMETMFDGQPAGKPSRIAVSSKRALNTFNAVESVEREHAALEQMSLVYATMGIDRSRVEGVDSQDKYAMVACGDADVYMRLPREAAPKHRSWDHAAGTALVQAAGGTVTDLDGSPLDFSTGAILTRNKGMIVSNGLAHDQIIEAVNTVWKPA